MERHTRTHTGIKQWTCDICGKLLSSKESITRHKAVFHQEERPYECETCGRTFKIKDTLKKHQKTHGEKKYKCEVGPMLPFLPFEPWHVISNNVAF